MYKNHTVSVILPCRNEANHLQEVVDRIPGWVDEVILVSNRSTDDTVKVARKLGLKVYEDNRAVGGVGYGYAHMTGIANATGDIVVGADGDATYPIEDLANIVEHLLDNKLDFVSCNRYPLQENTHIPFKLRLGVEVLNKEVHLLYGKKIHDILSGMWVFRRTISDQLSLTMGDWNLSPQIKLNALLHHDIAFAEYSIAQHQRMGESKQAHYKTGFQHLWWIFRHRFSVRFNWEPVS